MAYTPKKMQVSFSGDKPMEFAELNEEGDFSVAAKRLDSIKPLCEMVKAYVGAAKELLEGKYKHLAALAPQYLSNPGNVIIALCSDGVVIRYEKKAEKRAYFAADLPEPLAKGAWVLSQHLIHCHLEGSSERPDGEPGVELRMATHDPANDSRKDVFLARILFDVVVRQPKNFPPPPQKPYCLLSVRNSLELQLHGETLPANQSEGKGEPFVLRATLRLPVGWECIEIFPHVNIEQWKPEYAPTWAETDILAQTLVNQLRESHYQSLDPRAEVRKRYARVLNEFKALLDSEPEREQSLQTFLQTHPELLCPAHVQMWPKLPFGAHQSDFVFRDGLNDYLLVELERSTHRLFKQDGHATVELTHAQGQIVDWKRYLEDNLATIQRELKLPGISSNPRALIVIGRSSTLSEQHQRTLTAMENESPKLKIMTYDDVYNNAKAVIENLLGPLGDSGGNTQIYYPASP
jgi:hypothetical protein